MVKMDIAVLSVIAEYTLFVVRNHIYVDVNLCVGSMCQSNSPLVSVIGRIAP